MEIGEIISDALVYPFQNIKALIIYFILGIILGIAITGTLFGITAGAIAENAIAVIGSSVIGIIVALFLSFFINGYQLDIVKYGIERSSRGPEIDFIRQFMNGVKLLVVQIIYFIIPIIIGAILAVIFQHWLSFLLTAIVYIVFALAATMGECRLAKTDDLGYALSIGEAIGDISRIGILKVIAVIVIMFVITFIIYLITGAVQQWNSTVGGILLGILGVYITFFSGRAIGLLYSNV